MRTPGRKSFIVIGGALGVAALLSAHLARAAIGPSEASGKPGAKAAKSAASGKIPRSLVEQLTTLRDRVITLEGGVVAALRSQKQAQSNVKRIQELLVLQAKERQLGKQRMEELERTVVELETRRTQLVDRIEAHRKAIRRSLRSMESSAENDVRTGNLMKLPESERIEAPRRRALGNLASRGLKEIEILKADLADADHLGNRIQEEKGQLAYLFQDLREKESVLELNRQLQLDIISRKHEERLAQLENYRALKQAEGQVERLIGDFNARLELERANDAERAVNRAMSEGGSFERLKGHLPLPVTEGKVASSFGRVFDPKSRLYVFKKGVDIAAGPKAPVRAITGGKVAFSGELPSYGQVTIIDHGDHYYSLCANLGELSRKTGDVVAAGDAIGLSDSAGTPVYFEIRARNVPVNPLQWIVN